MFARPPLLFPTAETVGYILSSFFICRIQRLFLFQVDPKPRDVIIHIISFDIPIKYISPMALLGLFVNQIIVDAKKSGYGDYPNWLHGVAGGVTLGLMVFSLLIFAVYPDFWDVMGVDKDQGAQVAFYAVRMHALTCVYLDCMHGTHKLNIRWYVSKFEGLCDFYATEPEQNLEQADYCIDT